MKESVSTNLEGFFNVTEQKGSIVTKKVSYPLNEPTEVTTLVYCHQTSLFAKKDCVKHQSPLGLLGYCANDQQAIAWFNKNTEEFPFSWFAITSYAPLYTENTRLKVQAEHLYVYSTSGCSQVISLAQIENTNIETLFPYLPKEGQQQLKKQWRDEKKRQDRVVAYEMSRERFQQYTTQIALIYMGNTSLLYTFLGDYFQAMGLRPSWRDHDPYHFLARWLTVIYPFRRDRYQTTAIAAALLETALLHPKFQEENFFRLPHKMLRYKKQVIRLFADLLQGSSFYFALMPGFLEILFSSYPSVEVVTWGLRLLLSFYTLQNDSAFLLGIALFFLPQLPLLLEHVGIPVTAYLSEALEKITQLFIFRSLLVEFIPVPDASRLAERDLALQTAADRVARGRERLSIAITPLTFFFKVKPYSNEREKQSSLLCSREVSCERTTYRS